MDYELFHHGIQGMKWGVRRYQNLDGTLTDAGRARERKENSRSDRADSQLRKAGKHRSKVPSLYLTDWGKWNSERHTRKADHAEGKAYKLELQNKKEHSKMAKKAINEIDSLKKKSSKYSKMSQSEKLDEAKRQTAAKLSKMTMAEANKKSELYKESVNKFIERYGEADFDRYIGRRKY